MRYKIFSIIFIFPGRLLADSGDDFGGCGMMGSFFGWNGFGLPGFWGFIMMLIFWLAIIFGAIALFKWLANQNQREDGMKTALDILEVRYAKGEINKKEFEEKKKDLSK